VNVNMGVLLISFSDFRIDSFSEDVKNVLVTCV